MDFTTSELGEIAFAVRQIRNKSERQLRSGALLPDQAVKVEARATRCEGILCKIRNARKGLLDRRVEESLAE